MRARANPIYTSAAGFKSKNLFDLGANVSVDFQPDSDLDDDGSLPLHVSFPRSDY
jgi:hypothetical protein